MGASDRASATCVALTLLEADVSQQPLALQLHQHQEGVAHLAAFVAVARGSGFREAARGGKSTASTLSAAVRRIESHLGVRLLNRSTRSVTLTEAGRRLYDRLLPALEEVTAALDVVNSYRDSPVGTLRLNVPVIVARLILPPIAAGFLRVYPDIKLEVTVDDAFVDVLAAGCDAGVRYGERLAKDMVAVPIGPRTQRFAAGASPAYLRNHASPKHPRDLLTHPCIRGRFSSGVMPPWEFERNGRLVRVDPSGPLIVSVTAADMAVNAAIAGLGIVFLFEDWLQPAFSNGTLQPVLETWWQRFSGPFLYYPTRRYLPAPLRAFVDYLKALP